MQSCIKWIENFHTLPSLCFVVLIMCADVQYSQASLYVLRYKCVAADVEAVGTGQPAALRDSSNFGAAEEPVQALDDEAAQQAYVRSLVKR